METLMRLECCPHQVWMKFPGAFASRYHGCFGGADSQVDSSDTSEELAARAFGTGQKDTVDTQKF